MAVRLHREGHGLDRIGWLRAGVLGANDGILSTASLVVGVAAAAPEKGAVLVAGVAALIAGALSMGAGEYVSVASQADAEAAELERERRELIEQPQAELAELTGIYVQRGLTEALAAEVAQQLTAVDALGAHARDELGLTEGMRANPVQAAVASIIAFSAGGVLPLAVAMLTPQPHLALTVSGASLVCLGLLGAVSAKAGGASIRVAVTRILFWGVVAMAVTAGIGRLAGMAGL